jgi:hypothetical protein
VLGTYAHAANPKLLSPEPPTPTTPSSSPSRAGGCPSSTRPAEAKAGQERLKQLTGGGELTANADEPEPGHLPPTHTLVLTANDEPVLTDPAVRARVRLIPCDGDPEQVWLTRAAIGHVSGPAWRPRRPASWP